MYFVLYISNSGEGGESNRFFLQWMTSELKFSSCRITVGIDDETAEYLWWFSFSLEYSVRFFSYSQVRGIVWNVVEGLAVGVPIVVRRAGREAGIDT